MNNDLTERQQKLLTWSDYFRLLKRGIVNRGKGDPDNPWSDKDVKLRLWFDIVITELESDAMHLESGQPEQCRWQEEEIHDLAEMGGNIDVRNEPKGLSGISDNRVNEVDD